MPIQAVSLACIANFSSCIFARLQVIFFCPWLTASANGYHSGSGPRTTRITRPPADLIAEISLGNLQSLMTTSSVMVRSLFSKLAIQISSWKPRRATSVPQYCKTHLGVISRPKRLLHHSSRCSLQARLCRVRPSSNSRSQPKIWATASLSVLAKLSRLNSCMFTR